MIKSVLEEIIIALLLCLVIIVVLGILLYEYVPISKTIATPVQYSMSAEIRDQLAQSEEADDSQVVLTYEVNASDLTNYKRTQNYQPGKANPFGPVLVEQEDSEDGNTNTGSTNGKPSSSSNSSGTNDSNSNNDGTSNSSSGGKFFQNTGTK
ncbi:MAG: hypothetical protein HUJ68_02025 [Clostridia bacterium]|nr:hypothetical protein [Clostridia bacterium]